MLRDAQAPCAPFLHRAQLFAFLAGTATICAGVLTLLGWQFSVEELKSVIPGLVPMNPATAVAFMFAGASLMLLTGETISSRRRLAGHVLALIVALIGLATLCRYAYGWPIYLDGILYADRLANNQMAPNTAIQFLVAGLALLVVDVGANRAVTPAQGMSLLVTVGSFIALVGYAYGAEGLYGVAAYIPMALNTATVFAVIAVGILCMRPSYGVMRALAWRSSGGVVIRRLLPVALVIPFVLGWLRLWGENAGYYDTEFGVALSVGATVIMLMIVTWRTATALHDSDTERQQAMEDIRAYENIVQSVPIGLFVLRLDDPDDPRSLRLVAANPGAAQLLGFGVQAHLGECYAQIFPAVPESRLAEIARVAKTAEAVTLADIVYGDARVVERVWASKVFPLPNGAMGLAFEDVTERERAVRLVRELNQELERRVSERTAALAETNRQLLEKNRENEMFVYSVSHDLRSPLVNLEGFSKELALVGREIRGILADHDFPAAVKERGLSLVDGDMAEALHFIQTGVLRLSTIIDALLRLSRAGRVEYDWQTVSVAPVVGRIVESMAVTIGERQATLRVGELPAVWGDPTAIEQIFANLIGNALNYLDPTRPGRIEVGSIEAGSIEAGSVAFADRNGSGKPVEGRTFFVEDNGLGIPASYQAKIFQAFQRVHPDVAKGEGMGLTVVHRMVERHGGKVWFESVEGTGTTFFVTLPAPSEKTRSSLHPMRSPTGDQANGY